MARPFRPSGTGKRLRHGRGTGQTGAHLAEALPAADSLFYHRLVVRDGRCEGLCLPFPVGEGQLPRGFSFYSFAATRTAADGDAFVPALSEAPLSAFRLYLSDDGANSPERYDIVFNSSGDIADGIAATNAASDRRPSTGVYSLDGRMLSPAADRGNLPAGIYIIDGKKVARN